MKGKYTTSITLYSQNAIKVLMNIDSEAHSEFIAGLLLEYEREQKRKKKKKITNKIKDQHANYMDDELIIPR